MNKVEKEQELLGVLRIIAPGVPLRIALDDLAKAKLGALIVIGDTPEFVNLTNGGFKVNCDFSPQKLVELCKMDGAVILDSELKKILLANTLLVPDHTIPSNETGTRHKTAERIAKQTKQLVIAVSERKSNITVYKGSTKYVLQPMQDILSRATEVLQMLEKNKELFNELLLNLNVLEFTNLVSLNDVVMSLQRVEIISRIEEILRKYIIELGTEGSLVKIQLREIRKGLDSEELLILKDYGQRDAFNMKVELSELSLDQLSDTINIVNLLGYNTIDDKIMTKGFRILNKTSLNKNEIEMLIMELNDIYTLFSSPEKIASLIGEERSEMLVTEISRLKEQALLGKKI